MKKTSREKLIDTAIHKIELGSDYVDLSKALNIIDKQAKEINKLKEEKKDVLEKFFREFCASYHQHWTEYDIESILVEISDKLKDDWF